MAIFMRKYYNAPMDLQRRFVALKTFLHKHITLLEREPLEFYPNSLPTPYDKWIQQIENLKEEDLLQLECYQDTDALKGLQNVDEELLAYFENIKELSSVPGLGDNTIELDSKLQRGMPHKKRHEITCIKSFLSSPANTKTYTSFLDIGSGKGHLSMALLYDKEGKSTCVDMDEKLQTAGKAKLNQYLPQLRERIKYVPMRFEYTSKLDQDENSLILGLHCCGDLSVDLIKYHMQGSQDLLSFGCCYHKSKIFNLSKLSQFDPIHPSFQALTLATRSNRILDGESLKRRTRVKVYRYILHMILTDHLDENFSALGSAHHSDYGRSFPEYCEKHAPRVLGLELESLYEKYIRSYLLKQYLLSETIRSPLGRLLELYILIDRALFLEERGLVVELKSFFAPDLSPRNIGIFSKQKA